ncbi:uncharacterized protein LOC135489714 [Lineus longissimus]|uniref:uncharacterized protein LOC135489714 n=1 Tax=Lineus longissimus TaxID=88925 RepID=UPI00315DCF96
MSNHDGLSESGVEVTTPIAEVTTSTSDVSDAEGHQPNEFCSPTEGESAPCGPNQEESTPCGPNEGESEPSSPSQGVSTSCGLNQGESAPCRPSQGESVPSNPSQGEYVPCGSNEGWESELCGPSQGESKISGPNQGENELGCQSQGEHDGPPRSKQEDLETRGPSQGETESSCGQGKETLNTGESELATKGQNSGLGVTEPTTVAPGGQIGTGQSTSRVILQAFSSRTSLVCGILQIVLGLTVVGLTIGLISFWEKVHYARDGTGILGGALFIAAGISGIISARTRQSHHIITCMVLSILAAFFSGTLPAFIFVHAAFSHRIWRGFAAFLCAVTAVSFLELVVSVVQSAMCCRVTCCATPSSVCKSAGISCTAAESNYTV